MHETICAEAGGGWSFTLSLILLLVMGYIAHRRAMYVPPKTPLDEKDKPDDGE